MSKRPADPSPQNRIWRSKVTRAKLIAFQKLRWPAAANPIAAPGIEEDRYKPITFAARRFQEFDAALAQPLIIGPEVSRVKKKADPTPRLVADTSF